MCHAAVVNGAGGCDLALQIAVLLHGVHDDLMCFQLRISFDLWKQTAASHVELTVHLAAVAIVYGSATQGCHGFHHVFVKLHGAVYKPHHVLQNLHTLLKIVVYV